MPWIPGPVSPVRSAPMAVLHWRKRGVPIERCGDIERVTGGAVKRHELRPDIFDPPHQQQEAQA